METIKTVLSGAIGVRRKAAHEQAKLNPVHVIIAAVVFVILFILTLLTVVHFVTGNA
jgi:Protein of unknown function (DUF2970)